MPRFDCVNKGCTDNGGSGVRYISDKAYERMMDEGKSDPAHCPECKFWRENLEDYMAECQACGVTWLITIGKQRMYHKYNGKWETPTYCDMCTKNPNRVKAYMEAKEGEQLMDEYIQKYGTKPFWDEIVEDETERLRDEAGFLNTTLNIMAGVTSQLTEVSLRAASAKNGVKPVTVVTDPTFYKNMPDHSKRQLKNSWVHIENHFEDLRDRLGATSPEDGLLKVQEIAQCTDPTRIIDFQIKGGIIKYDIQNQMQTVLKPLNPGPPDYRVVSSYCPNDKMEPLEWVIDRISAKDWKLPKP